MYLDDGLCAVDVEAKALEARALVKTTLDHSGFVAHVKKCIMDTHPVATVAGICCRPIERTY